MRNLSVLVTALEVIENNLRERFTVEDLAKECYVSVSCLQKLFGYVFGLSVGEYLLKRRLSAATYDLVNTKKYNKYCTNLRIYISGSIFKGFH